MKIILLVPKVIQNFVGQFPETTNNAYDYFNYDNRVVDERAEHRFDVQRPFKGPEELTNEDYDTIVSYARSLINPILSKYSHHVACEDALHMAIRSFERGIYDGKINASKYEVLLKAMEMPQPQVAPMPLMPGLPGMPAPVMPSMRPPLMAKKEHKKAPEKSKVVPRNVLRNLGIKIVPLKSQVRPSKKVGPMFVKQPGKGIVIDK